MKKFFSFLFLSLFLCLSSSAEDLSLTGVDRYGSWEYPLMAKFSSQGANINLVNKSFSAAEFYRYRIEFYKPISDGFKLYIQNSTEASKYQGHDISIKGGTSIVEGTIDVSSLADGDYYITGFKLQSTDSQVKYAYIKSVYLFNEYDDSVPQTPSASGWFAGKAVSEDGPFYFSAPLTFWGMTTYSQMGPWQNPVENGYADKINLVSLDTIPPGFVFTYKYIEKLASNKDSIITVTVPVSVTAGQNRFSFTIPHSYTDLYLRYVGTIDQKFAIKKIERTTFFVPPYVYDVENTDADSPDPPYPTATESKVIEKLPNPFAWADGSGEITSFMDWSKRRGEIARQIQHYEIGTKPTVDVSALTAKMLNDTLFVDVTIDGRTLQLKSKITYPKNGRAPYALMIGMNGDGGSLPKALFQGKNIAFMSFTSAQVNPYQQNSGQTRANRKDYPFVKLYPNLIDNGAYADWAWGVSRLIDGIQILGEDVSKIDMKHIGVTGCSYAGKMALFAGAFDERIALTIAQEPGGGGAAAWRVSHQGNGTCAWTKAYQKTGSVETLDATDYNWFKESLRTEYGEDNVYKLPYDHHELCAMICPRALLMLGNTDYPWLADRSGYVSMNAAKKVWEKFGIPERVGYSIVGGHSHCSLPTEQYDEVIRFIDRYLLGNDSISTDNIAKAPDFLPEKSPDPILNIDTWTDWWSTNASSLLPRPTYHWYYFEGEDMRSEAQGKAWIVKEEASCRNGKYVQSPDVRVTELPTDADYILSKDIDIEEAGDYNVYALLSANGRTHDACYMSFDDNTPSRVNGLNTDGEWKWVNMIKSIDDGTRDDFNTALKAGAHTFFIFAKESELKIDAFCISNNDTLPQQTTNDIHKLVEENHFCKVVAVNTANGKLEVILTSSANANSDIDVIDETGRILGNARNVAIHAGDNKIVIPAELSGNIVIVSVKTGSTRYIRKFGVKRNE